MLVVPTQAIPNQVLQVVLGGQACTIHIYQKSTGLYLDLSVNDALIIGGVLCLVGVKLVRSDYLGFAGDLAFFDTRPADPPMVDGVPPDQIVSSGLGGRYFLAYLP
jgi:hypothetical protein